MAVVKVDKLVKGAVLSEDVLDVNSRLLLAKGQAIDERHIRVMKMWGVFEVHVESQDAEQAIEESPPVNSEQMAAVGEEIKGVFKALDLDHPVVREIVRLCAQYRLEHYKPARVPVALAADPDAKLAGAQELMAKIDRIDIKLPEVPSLVFELNEIIADPMSSAGDLAQVVNKSPSLTATLLRIVNSAFYGFRSKIDSISRAVTLIGSKEVSNLALGVTIMETFQRIPKQIVDVASFLEHSLACGTTARILAAHGNMAHTEQLFIAGMLHDIGRLILCKYFPQIAKHTFVLAAQQNMPLLKAEQAVLGCTHTFLGKKLLNKWKLPYALENNVYYHHHPSAAPNPEMAGILQVADMIVHGMGIGNSCETAVPSFDDKAWERVKLPLGALHALIKQAQYQIETFRGIFEQRIK